MAELITDLKNRNMELQFRVNELEAENPLYRQSFKRIGEWLSKTGDPGDVYIWMGRDAREAIDAARRESDG